MSSADNRPSTHSIYTTSNPMHAGRLHVSGAPRSVGEVADELQLILGDATKRQAYDILAALLDVPRFWPSQHAAESLVPDIYTAAISAAHRLQRGAPFAYAVGKAAFRHLTLDVDERVLIPRPETELLVDEVLHRTADTSLGTGVAVDLCTGSGAIALSLASEGAFSRVIATDVSLDALAVAKHNAALLAGALQTPVEFRHGSLVAPVRDVTASVVVSNPPYIAYDEASALPASVRDWEPALALLSGNDGMAATIAIIRDAADILMPGGLLVLEVDVRRAALVAELVATNTRYDGVAVRLDLAGRERFVVARKSQ